MSFTNPQIPIENPKRHYDKFGFLVAAEQNDNRELEYPQKSRYHRRTTPEFGGRNNNRESDRFSPNRRERENYNRSERIDREGRRRKRNDYSPSFNKVERPDRGNKRDDRMDFDSWENSYNPPPNFVTAPLPPSYTTEVPQSYPDPPPYGQFPPAQYNNFLEAPRQEPGPEMGVPPPPPAPSLQQSNWAPTPPVLNTQEDKVKREAIASEMRNQRATLAKQKEEYFKKATVLKRELESLKQQRIELRGDSKRSPSPDSQRFLKENAKLQIEIQNKMKTINNVIDMLNGIIGENPTSGEILESKSKSRKPGLPRTPTQSPPSSRSSSADSDKHSSSRNKRKSRSKSRTKLSDKKFNYVFYDPEMHWCRVCNEFPATAKEYLNHLHSPGHHRNALAHLEAPWHDVVTNQNEGMPSYPGVSSKRTPIKGLQFFVPSTAWYCKLCDQWIGDLHCASAHLKSLLHSQNYSNFTELNPHWEMDWISDRQKNFEKVHKTGEPPAAAEPQKALYSPHTISFQADGFHTKKKKGSSPQLEKNAPEEKLNDKKDKKKKDKKKSKKKKRSSSESSTSSSSSNASREEPKKMKKPNKDPEEGKEEQAPRDLAADDRMLSQWMSLKQDTLTDQDKKILEKLKHRVKTRAGEKVEQKVDGRVVSREREAREVLTIQGGSRCPESLLYQRKDTRDEKKPKDSRSNRERDYEREAESSKRHQDFKPYPGRREKQDQNEERFDKQVAEKLRKQGTSTSDSKKMPFIGKMPLFKSLSNKPVKSEEPKPPVDPQKCVEAAKKKRDEINAQIEEMKEKVLIRELFFRSALPVKEQPKPDLPAPGLALPTSLAEPLPAPVVSEPPATNRAPPLSMTAYPQTIHKIQKAPTIIPDPPPPVIAAKADIKAAPQSASKNESLHKDFQDALDIIFPSGNPPKKEQTQNKSNNHSPIESDMGHLTNIPPPSMSQGYPQMMQQNYGMGQMGPMGSNNMGPMGPTMGPMGPMGPNMGHMGPMGPMGSNNMGPMGPNMGPMGPMGPNTMGPMGPNNMGPMGPNSMGPMGPPPPGMNMMGMPPSGHMGMMGWDYSGGMYPQTGLYDTMSQQPSNNAPSSKGRHEQEDLAMLGIDAEDIGASGF